MMDISGMIQSQAYDQGAASSAAMPRVIMAPQYNTVSYSGGMLHRQQPNHGIYTNSSYTTSPTTGLLPTMNYIRQRPQIPMLNPVPAGISSMPYTRNTGPRYIEDQHSPVIKPEPQTLSSTSAAWETSMPSSYLPTSLSSSGSTTTAATTSTISTETNFGTDVDTLMRAIQSKLRPSSPGAKSPVKQAHAVAEVAKEVLAPSDDVPEDPKKRYECHIPNCKKSFFQKTHLEIHIRAHTGVKPYTCKWEGCNQCFSQLGNLKTHERRHSGERPYQCEICGKRFAQRGNVRAHRSVHNPSKPYICKLDDCGKQFTQLGNLKSHQNKFHTESLRNLTLKFASIRNGDTVSAADKELFQYFATLYKNSNKGIKGRGKDRKVASANPPQSSPQHSQLHHMHSHQGPTQQGLDTLARFSGYNDRAMVMGYDRDFDDRAYDDRYEAYEGFEAVDESVSGGSNGTGSSTESIYGVDAVEGYEAEGRGLAFGDRLY